MGECQFCEAIAFQKAMHRTYNKKADDGSKIYHEYTVALVDRSWTKAKGKRRASRLTDYRYKGIGYELNYCPECGAKMRKKLYGKTIDSVYTDETHEEYVKEEDDGR